MQSFCTFRRLVAVLPMLLWMLPAAGQTEVTFELSATAASGDFAPLWLTSNRYGLGSVEPQSIYERVRAEKDIRRDTTTEIGRAHV